MRQVCAVPDAYGYRPMIRQASARRVFAPLEDGAASERAVAKGPAAARPVSSALEASAAAGAIPNGRTITLADRHAAAMVDDFTRAPEGAAPLAAHPRLRAWWAVLFDRPAMAPLDGPR